MRLLSEAEKSEKENQTLIQRIDQYQDYAKRIHILGAEIDRLMLTNQNLDSTLGVYRLKIADMSTLEKRLQEQLGLMVVVFAEIESLRGQVSNNKT